MNFGENSRKLLKYVRAKAKLNEYAVSKEERKRNKLTYKSSIDLLCATVRVLSEFAEAERNGAETTELYAKLTFVAKFFENYIEAEQEAIDYFFYLTGAIANILSDNFGNAKSLTNRIDIAQGEINAIACLTLDYIQAGLINASGGLTQATDNVLFERYFIPLEREIKDITADSCDFILNNLAEETLMKGSPESAFFANLLSSIRNKYLANAAMRNIPQFSNSNLTAWDKYFRQQGSIKILWQAQKLLLEKEILKGKSATIQLPTGVGKTRSIELIISSAFLLRNVSLAIVVAPLRALCNEIEKDLERSIRSIVSITDISDVLMEDIGFDFGKKQVIVLTPEKLSFLIKHDSNIVHKCGLIIFDEAHLFDDPSRGATYELLIVKVKNLLDEKAQKVFISAVMPNAEQINDWLTDGDGVTVTDKDIKRTEKSIGFFSQRKNCIQFYDQQELIGGGEETVFIPQICPKEPFVLTRYQKKTSKGGKTFFKGDPMDVFPKRNNSADVALHLSLKLCRTGIVALYVNQPKLIYSMAKRIVALSDKKYPELRNIIKKSNEKEITKIFNLAKKHFGDDVEFVKIMQLGVFPHYGNLENGLRLSIEHAVKKGLLVFVLCTSTLAEGVNLPIRYLIVTSFLNAYGQTLSTRKFQNLLGRTARAGIHTEGSLICSKHEIIDDRLSNPKQWSEILNIFKPSNSEDCSSAILQIFDELDIAHLYGQPVLIKGEILVEKYLEIYTGQTLSIEDELFRKISVGVQSKGYKLRRNASDRLKGRMAQIRSIVEAIEATILDENGNTSKCAELTLAYNLANSEQKRLIANLFTVVENKISEIPTEKRFFFSKAMNNIDTLNMVDCFLQDRQDLYNDCIFNETAWIAAIIDISKQYPSMSPAYEKLQETTAMINAWIGGKSYKEISAISGCNVEKLIGICQHDMGFSLNHLIACVVEISQQYKPENKTDIEWSSFMGKVLLLQQRIKYGLASIAEIAAYEMGFADRVIAGELGRFLVNKFGDQTLENYKLCIIDSKAEIESMMAKYPLYFADIASHLYS